MLIIVKIIRRRVGVFANKSDSPVPRRLALAEDTRVATRYLENSRAISRRKLRHALNNFQLRKLIRVAICLIIWSTERYRRGKACGRQARAAGIRALAYEIRKSAQYARETKLKRILMWGVTIVTTCLSLPLSLSLFAARWFQKLRTIVGFLQFRQRESVIGGSRNQSDRIGQ